MSDRNAILDALVFIAHEIIDRVYDEDGTHRDMADDIAAAVLELVGPERLAWVGVTTYGGKAYDTATFGRTYRIIPKDGGEVYLTDHECGGFFATIELAQAAAQAHADAAHWANTKIGGSDG